MMKVDLHSHSRYSDGTLDPTSVVEAAHRAGVQALSLTDHDSTAGLDEATQRAKELGVFFIAGIEINTSEGDNLHILGYGIKMKDPKFIQRLTTFRERREVRAKLIVEKCQKKLNFNLRYEDVQARVGHSVGRPHIADALREKGYARSREEAFQKYLMRGRPAYAPPMGPTATEALTSIRETGGVGILAHPSAARLTEGLLTRLVELGLGGLEVYYPTHKPHEIRLLLGWVKQYHLLVTAGSDFHGPGSGRERIGVVDCPELDFKEFCNGIGNHKH